MRDQSHLASTAMKFAVKRFKNLALALKEIAPFLNARQVRSGAPIDNFGDMRPREMLANWLICAAFNSESQPERLTVASTHDPIGGDGVLVDTVTEETWPTEHIIALVPPGDTKGQETHALAAVAQKLKKGGAAYAVGKTLVVLLEGGGEQPWYPNKVAKGLPKPLHFGAVWVVGLQDVDTGEYIYNVTQMDEEAGVAYVWRVRIAPDFDKWTVSRIQ
jgi:hypothetical protein